MVLTYQLSALQQDGHTRRALTELSLRIAKCKRVVVVTGAGVSCSSGVPDFRSSDGIYDLVNQRYPEVPMKGRSLFDVSLFRDATLTAIFYSFTAELKMVIDKALPSPTHQFIKAIYDKNMLLRSYTQNIDGLEARVGLPCSSSEAARSTGNAKNEFKIKQVKNVQLHGDIHRVRCTVCSANYPNSPEFLEVFRKGQAPNCPECATRSADRVARSARFIRVGSLRPAIVLYNETHPSGDEIADMCAADLRRKPDLLIIMGTSLKVDGVKTLVKAFAKAVHARPPSSPEGATSGGMVMFINKTEPTAEWARIIDVHIAGLSDDWVKTVLHDWEMSPPGDWGIQNTIEASAGGALTSQTQSIGTEATELRAGHGPSRSTSQPMTPHSDPPSQPERCSGREADQDERLPRVDGGVLLSIMQMAWTLADIRIVGLLIALGLLFLL